MYACSGQLLLVSMLLTGVLPTTHALIEEQAGYSRHGRENTVTYRGEGDGDMSSPCFGDQCRCDETKAKADCSQNYGNLTFVPKLPDYVQFLNFTYNNLSAITKGDFFANVTHLLYLDLGDNDLTYIHPQAFTVFRNMLEVFLDYNKNLTFTAIEPVLSTSTLRRLDLRHGELRTIPEDIFHRFPLPNLTTLFLHDNKLKKLNFSTLSPLRKLSNLGMANNQIVEVDSDLMESLERLNLQNSYFNKFPVTCTMNGRSLFPRLSELFLSHNLIYAITGDVCLPRLTFLQLSFGMLTEFVADMFGPRRFPSLSILLLESQRTHKKSIDAHAFRNPGLTDLHLKYNSFYFGAQRVSADSFSGCSNLTLLQLSQSDFSNVTQEKWVKLFKPLQKLTSLNLGSSSLKNLFKDAFKDLPLLQRLHLFDNSLSNLPDGIFDQLNLTHLELDHNQLSVITESTFSVRTRSRLKSLDLSGNPFHCSCSLLWFHTWFMSKPAIFTNSRGHYQCKNLPGTQLTSFSINPQACLLSHDTYAIMMTVVAMVMVVTVLVSAIFHYRWTLRLWLYEAFRGRDAQLRQRRLREQRFDYDVFVSYDASDSAWVVDVLRPVLEDVWGLRLCLHQRDFVPGNNIADNIVDCVQASKKVLMVFSPGFCQSPWCQFELNFCLRHIHTYTHVMDFDDALVVVQLRDVAARDMTSIMMAVHRMTTYIQWQEGAEAQVSFWGRLRIAFQEILE